MVISNPENLLSRTHQDQAAIMQSWRDNIHKIYYLGHTRSSGHCAIVQTFHAPYNHWSVASGEMVYLIGGF